MTREIFLYLSQRPGLRRWMERSPLARKLTRRFIAGETLEDELAVARELASEGIFTTADHLGENITNLAEGVAARDAYMEALNSIAAHKLTASISLKLTALGLDVSEEAAVAHLRALAARAKEIGSRVEIDMEDARYTDTTIRIAELVSGETGCILVAIQAYLYRTPVDIDRLNKARVMVRLTKGAYIEAPTVAMPKKSDVDVAYEALAKTLLEQGTHPALATHDAAMLERLLKFVRERNVSAGSFEFEMLHGVRRDLQRSLVKQGYRMRVYVPYGTEWYRYFMRRLAERPANVWFIAKNLFR